MIPNLDKFQRGKDRCLVALYKQQIQLYERIKKSKSLQKNLEHGNLWPYFA